MLKQTKHSRIYTPSQKKSTASANATNPSRGRWRRSSSQAKKIPTLGASAAPSMAAMLHKSVVSSNILPTKPRHSTSMPSQCRSSASRPATFNVSSTTPRGLSIPMNGLNSAAVYPTYVHACATLPRRQPAWSKSTEVRKPCLSFGAKCLSVLQNWQERLSKR